MSARAPWFGDRELEAADRAVAILARRIRAVCPVCRGRINGLGHRNDCAVLAAQDRLARSTNRQPRGET